MRIKGRKEFISYIKNFIKIDAVADWIKLHHSWFAYS